MPDGYGVPTGEEGMLPWSHASERLVRARNYWIGTTQPDGQPHAMPVWGVWVNETLYFGMDPRTRTARNLAANPALVVHLESGDDVVILKGTAEVVTNAALLARIGKFFAAKYEGGEEPGEEPGGAEGDAGGAEGDAGGGGMYAVRPRVAYAWSQFPGNATRWRFGERG
jgi:general stress protein 26